MSPILQPRGGGLAFLLMVGLLGGAPMPEARDPQPREPEEPPETLEQRRARREAADQAWRDGRPERERAAAVHTAREQKWQRDQDELHRQVRARNRQKLDDERTAALTCARCDSSGITRKHKNGRPAKPHTCPECRDVRKAWRNR